ncbi:hypothetical protein [Streptomyces sp. NPDC052701]|uniref:hypothetical protein n=1 Tax=Streptomyces sp. NPDC052701 TaxID=3155533 RepID=UPI0034436349
MRGILRLSAAARGAGPSRVARVHRTTTAATLLVTVAVSALTGCVTVRHPLVPGPSAAPGRPSAPHPDARSETQIVQAPAREALELTGPSRSPEPAAPPSRRAVAPAPRPEPPSGPHDRPARPARPEAREPDARRPRRPAPAVPDVPRPARHTARETPNVCALGREYGGWRADSPEAVICRQAYGR